MAFSQKLNPVVVEKKKLLKKMAPEVVPNAPEKPITGSRPSKKETKKPVKVMRKAINKVMVPLKKMEQKKTSTPANPALSKTAFPSKKESIKTLAKKKPVNKVQNAISKIMR
jgi:hypothetical protein